MKAATPAKPDIIKLNNVLPEVGFRLKLLAVTREEFEEFGDLELILLLILLDT